MAIDTLLVLEAGQTVVADSNSDYVECEGGILMWAHIFWGTLSGGSTTCDARVMVSVDAGANYFMKAKFQQVGPTDDNKEDRVPVYIPQPTTAGVKCRVRLNYDVAGGAPSYAVTQAFLEILHGNSVPAIDEQNTTGAASLISAL